MSDTLVDSSCWIDFFRGDAAAKRKVDPLLRDGRAAMAGPIYAEVVSGATTLLMFNRLQLLVRSLPWLEAPADVWQQIAEARFALSRRGVQAHLVDLLIAVTAAHLGHALLTRDKDFHRIAQVIAVDVLVF